MKKSKKIPLISAAVLFLAGFLIWKTQLLHIVDRVTSPDGRYTATVLEIERRDLWDESQKVPTVFVRLSWPHGGGFGVQHATYDELYWSPDSTMHVLETTPLNYHGVSLNLTNLKTDSAAFLSTAVTSCLNQTSLADYGFPLNERERPEIDLTFLQWAEDSSAVQLRYAFTDTSGVNRTGTFWFHLVWDDGFLDYTVESITDLREEA